MDAETTLLAGDVERLRPRLFGIAYRMLGDIQDAEDAVQDAFLRWQQTEQDAVWSSEAWLVSVVTRLAIDRLRRAKTERAAYAGPWLPEPVTSERIATDRAAEVSSDMSMAFLLLLERLAPEERAAFLLREVFDTGYTEIANTLDRSEAAVRQMVHRARARVRTERIRFASRPDVHQRMLERFLAAVAADDKEEVLAVLAPDVTFSSDGGGKISAARRVVQGADRVARMVLSLDAKYKGVHAHRIGHFNGEEAVLTYSGGRIFAVTFYETVGDRIVAAYRVMNPDKLRFVR
jgi:RNA polymerase sigma-70 factor, ECF subfamily